VSGRILEVQGKQAQVELGEGVRATCQVPAGKDKKEEAQPAAKADLASLTLMLNARWKSGAPAGAAEADGLQRGQIRSVRITRLDAENKSIEGELV